MRHLTRWRPAVAGLLTAAWLSVGMAHQMPTAFGQAEYVLYYSLDLPLSIPGLTLTDQGTRRTYVGALRGSLGGLPLTEGSYTYANGASQRAGGGTFTMATKAGPIRAGQILMTSDGKQTTLLFFGTYLGARLSFALTGSGDQFGGAGVVATGLAETTFQSHEQYVAAIREATAGLPQAARDELLTAADRNPRLVRDYQQKSSSH